MKESLEKIGLLRAYTGLGAVLTDYLGMPDKYFPFAISKKENKLSFKLVDNMIKVGNFGYNRKYVQAHGAIHGLEQMWYVIGQCCKFGFLAPAESWGYIPVMIRWWGKKLIGIV